MLQTKGDKVSIIIKHFTLHDVQVSTSRKRSTFNYFRNKLVCRSPSLSRTYSENFFISITITVFDLNVVFFNQRAAVSLFSVSPSFCLLICLSKCLVLLIFRITVSLLVNYFASMSSGSPCSFHVMSIIWIERSLIWIWITSFQLCSSVTKLYKDGG